MRIDRCICTNMTFVQLRVLAEAEGLDLAQLQARCGASSQCGRCEPYLRRMLQDGTTVFHDLLRQPSRVP